MKNNRKRYAQITLSLIAMMMCATPILGVKHVYFVSDCEANRKATQNLFESFEEITKDELQEKSRVILVDYITTARCSASKAVGTLKELCSNTEHEEFRKLNPLVIYFTCARMGTAAAGSHKIDEATVPYYKFLCDPKTFRLNAGQEMVKEKLMSKFPST